MDIVPADETHADELASLHVKAWKKAYTGIVPKEYLDSLSIKNRKERFLQAVKDKHPFPCSQSIRLKYIRWF